MTVEEFDNWKAWTDTTSRTWTIDPIHDGKEGRKLLAHIGGVDGKFVQVDGGEIALGSYEGAIPHIGEASFRIEGKKNYLTFDIAVTHLIEAGGLNFLLDILAYR